jgi:glycine dehydrogenase subunit 1
MGIYGGIDLSTQFPELGQSLLVSVTEVHSKKDVDRLVKSVEQAVEAK